MVYTAANTTQVATMSETTVTFSRVSAPVTMSSPVETSPRDWAAPMATSPPRTNSSGVTVTRPTSSRTPVSASSAANMVTPTLSYRRAV